MVRIDQFRQPLSHGIQGLGLQLILAMREGYLGFLDSWMVTALICLNNEAAFALGIPVGDALSLITMIVSGGRALETVHCFSTITMRHARIINPCSRNCMHFTDSMEVFWFYWTWPEVPNLHQSGSISHSCGALLYPLRGQVPTSVSAETPLPGRPVPDSPDGGNVCMVLSSVLACLLRVPHQEVIPSAEPDSLREVSTFAGLVFPPKYSHLGGKSGSSAFHETQLGIGFVPWPSLQRRTAQVGACCSSHGTAIGREHALEPLIRKVLRSRGFGSGTGDRLIIPALCLRFLICKVGIPVDLSCGASVGMKDCMCQVPGT